MGRGNLLEVAVELSPGTIVVRAAGELDMSSCAQLAEALTEAAQRPGDLPLRLDLRHLTFIDARGLGVIVRASGELGERFSMSTLTPFVQRVFEITGLHETLPISRDADSGDSGDEAARDNLDYVRRLWTAWLADVTTFAGLIADDVEFRPWQSHGHVLHGSGEVLEFSRGPGVCPVQATAFSSVGDDVLVRLELRLSDGSVKELWSLCQFRGSTFVGAITFDRKADALAAAA